MWICKQMPYMDLRCGISSFHLAVDPVRKEGIPLCLI